MPSLRPRNRMVLLLLVTALVAVACAVARVALDAPFGLQGQYFLPGRATTEPPSLTTIDRQVSTDIVTANWVGDPPATFKVRWFGFLTAPASRAYTFALEADDGAVLSIDDRVVVDNGGVHGPVIATGETMLSAGPHAVLIDYQQAGGGFAISLRWATGGGSDAGALQVIPVEALTPKRVAAWKLAAARWLERTIRLLAGLAGVVALVVTWQRRHELATVVETSLRRAPRAAALALFIVLAIAETWPLASAPGRYSRNDNSDTVLNEWTISWVAHQAVHDPRRLFDANIFYPERRTLAYSEAMPVQAAMAAPILWFGGSPVLAYNLVLLAGFALSGWVMSLVLVRWTGSWIAALTGGVIFAFNAHSFTRLPHLQAQHVEFLPLTLLALDALLDRPNLRHALRLAGWFVLQALTSVYLLVFTATALVVSALVRPRDWWGARCVPVLAWSAVAGGLAAIVLAPFIVPYWQVSRDLGLTRSLDDARRFVVNAGAYLATPARLHFSAWSGSFFIADALFPGAIALGLTAYAIARGIAWRDPRARMCLAVGLAGLYLSFGPAAPGYALLYAVNPLLHAIRAVSRFGYLVIVAVAVLAAFGLADILARLRPSRGRIVLAVMPLLVALEVTPAPVGYTRFDGISPIYDRLRKDGRADDGRAVVVEFPFYRQGAEFHHAAYMLNSTRHWQPLVNGYSGFQPLSFHAAADALYAFPAGPWLAFLRQRGVTHLFVHRSAYPAAIIDQLERMPELEKVADEDAIALYRLRS